MNPFNVKDNTTIDTGKLEKIFLEEGICKKLNTIAKSKNSRPKNKMCH